MKFPWSKPEPETEQRDFTSAVTEALVTSAQMVTGVPSAQLLAGAMINRAFSSAEVSGDAAHLFDVEKLSNMAYELVVSGETIWMNRSAMLHHVNSYSVLTAGSYEVSINAETENIVVQPGNILHTRFSKDYLTLRGYGPGQVLQNMRDALVSLEQGFADELSGPSGYLLALPVGGADGTIENMKEDLAELKGRVMIVKTQRDNWQQGGPGSVGSVEYKPQRIGPDIPESNIVLYEKLNENFLAALGVPIDLVKPGEATAQRESWRRFLHGTIQPLAKKIEDAAQRIGLQISVNFDELFASDLSGRSRSFGSIINALVQAKEAGLDVSGFNVDEALKLAGLMEND